MLFAKAKRHKFATVLAGKYFVQDVGVAIVDAMNTVLSAVSIKSGGAGQVSLQGQFTRTQQTLSPYSWKLFFCQSL